MVKKLLVTGQLIETGIFLCIILYRLIPWLSRPKNAYLHIMTRNTTVDGLATKDKNWSFLILRFQTSKQRSIGVNALIQNFTFNLLLPRFGWLCFLTIGSYLTFPATLFKIPESQTYA